MSHYTSKWISGDNVLYRGETRLVSIRRENSGRIVTELNTLQAEIEALRQRVAELEAELAEWKTIDNTPGGVKPERVKRFVESACKDYDKLRPYSSIEDSMEVVEGAIIYIKKLEADLEACQEGYRHIGY